MIVRIFSRGLRIFFAKGFLEEFLVNNNTRDLLDLMAIAAGENLFFAQK